MQIFSIFYNDLFLEMAILTLEKNGVEKDHIFAIPLPLDHRMEDRKQFDSIHRSGGTSLIDIGMALATAFSVMGISIGFKLAWGPIWWGSSVQVLGW